MSNPITFNDHLADAFRLLLAGSQMVDTPHWRTMPLFVHETTQAKENDTFEATEWKPGPHVFDVLPFEIFRLDLTVRAASGKDVMDGSWGRYHARCLVGRDSRERLTIVGAVDSLYKHPDDPVKNRGSMMLPIWCYAGGIQWSEERQAHTYIIGLGVHGRWLTQKELNVPQQIKDAIHSYVEGLITSVAGFVLEAMSPQVHIATVSPARQNKSVEWIKARTHYTLISHGHPANSKTVREGESVEVDQAKELTRMAHNRRAHWREYKHERYRFARGQRQLIKATWIGPKCWKDEGSRQIYRILEERKQ